MFLSKIAKKIKAFKLFKIIDDIDPANKIGSLIYNFIDNEYNQTARTSLLLKLNKVYKQGYLPARKNQSYHWVRTSDKAHIETMFNCFAHACFNMTNEIILKENFTKEECIMFGSFSTAELLNPKLFESKMFDFINQAGLKIQICSETEKLNSNQWKVALMLNEEGLDFHFLLQEKDGSWSSKHGKTGIVDTFHTLPKEYSREDFLRYNLYKTYAITNPNAKNVLTQSKSEKEKAD